MNSYHRKQAFVISYKPKEINALHLYQNVKVVIQSGKKYDDSEN